MTDDPMQDPCKRPGGTLGRMMGYGPAASPSVVPQADLTSPETEAKPRCRACEKPRRKGHAVPEEAPATPEAPAP